MKKIASLLMILLVSIVSAVAVDMTITPQVSKLDFTDSKDVKVCITRANGSPYVGLALTVGPSCLDENHNEACDAAELGNAAGTFAVTVKTSPTGADGCGEVTVSSTAAATGDYAYSVNGKDGATVVDSEGGLAVIPEFGIGASLAILAGAGLYIARRRKKH